MRIQLLETAPVWMNAAESCRQAEDMVREGTDLIVLPEMFATGFALDPRAADAAPETLEWMQRLAREKDAAVAGSMAVREGDKIFNRLYFVRPDGVADHYDKRHLFTYAGEDDVFSAGKKRVITEWRGVRILLQTCYDLRFPVFSRNRNARNGSTRNSSTRNSSTHMNNTQNSNTHNINSGNYDMALYCASWPESRIGAWDILLRARAVENACYVAGVNRTGSDPSARYNGHSVLLDFLGNPADEVDIKKLTDFREKSPALDDADEFSMP